MSLCKLLPSQRFFFDPLFPISSSSPSLARRFLPLSSPLLSLRSPRNLWVSTEMDSSSQIQETDSPPKTNARKTWKPMCLYHTQGKCTLMDDAVHLEKFSHSYSTDLRVSASNASNLRTQELDFVLVLDLEGKVEILEYPVVMIDTRTMEFIDSFHRFVRPTEMSEKRVNEYIEGKYGKFGIDRVWHDTAIPFKDVLKEFDLWMSNHHLLKKETGGSLHRAAFVTCGNWDIKTKIPEQCKVSKIKLPPYFMEWINLKDIYLNFYNRRITARRSSSDPSDVKFLFKNRV